MIHQGQIVLGLFFGAYMKDHFGKHFMVIRHRICSCKHKGPVKILATLPRVICKQVSILVTLHDNTKSLPPLLQAFLACLLVVVFTCSDLRIIFYQAFDYAELEPLIFRVQRDVGLFSVKRALCSFFDQQRIHYFALDRATHCVGVEIRLILLLCS